MVTKFKNLNFDKTQKSKSDKKSTWDKSQVVTKLKLGQNSNCDKTQVVTKPKLWQNSNCEKKKKKIKIKYDKTQIVTVVTFWQKWPKNFLHNKTKKQTKKNNYKQKNSQKT